MLNQMIKNLKIRSRMLISYFIIVLLLLIVGITSIVMLNQSSKRYPWLWMPAAPYSPPGAISSRPL